MDCSNRPNIGAETEKKMRTLSNMNTTDAKCYECGRIFDLLNEREADEWHYGHDCEETS